MGGNPNRMYPRAARQAPVIPPDNRACAAACGMTVPMPRMMGFIKLAILSAACNDAVAAVPANTAKAQGNSWVRSSTTS